MVQPPHPSFNTTNINEAAERNEIQMPSSDLTKDDQVQDEAQTSSLTSSSCQDEKLDDVQEIFKMRHRESISSIEQESMENKTQAEITALKKHQHARDGGSKNSFDTLQKYSQQEIQDLSQIR